MTNLTDQSNLKLNPEGWEPLKQACDKEKPSKAQEQETLVTLKWGRVQVSLGREGFFKPLYK